MSLSYGTQTVKLIPEKRLVISSASSKTNLEDIKWLADTVLEQVESWANEGWAYIADCTHMTPVTSLESSFLTDMTKRFIDMGCKAFGFAEGKSFMLRIQTHNHTARFGTEILEGHFETVEEALDWVSKAIHY